MRVRRGDITLKKNSMKYNISRVSEINDDTPNGNLSPISVQG
jgi:hypothetical protein